MIVFSTIFSCDSETGLYAIGGALLHDRLHDGILKIAVELPVGVVRLDHEDADYFLLGVHPEVRAEGAIPAEASVGDSEAGRHRVVDHLHAQPETTPLRA